MRISYWMRKRFRPNLLSGVAISGLCLLFGGPVQAANNVGTGGTVTYTDASGLNPSNEPYRGGYVVHTFTSDGILTLPADVSADFVLVGGGGQGGYGYGGGGGAGGMLTGSVSLATSPYTIVVGGGGAGSANLGTTGGNSTFNGLTAYGGGGGNGFGGAGASGGSGGGGGGDGSSTGGSGTAGQGNNGGGGAATANGRGGGGGGAGGAGVTGTGAGGAGGPAKTSSISGTTKYYAQGGCAYNAVNSPNHGGGNTGANGTANTGGGGGAYNGSTRGNGGSGIVIVRYPYLDDGGFTILLDSPVNNQSYLFGSPLMATATVVSGTPPYSMTFYKDSIAVWTTNSSSRTCTVNLGALALGSHTLYATVTDSASPTPATAVSTTNTFTVIVWPTSFFWTNTVSGVWSAAGNWTNDQGVEVAPLNSGSAQVALNFSQAGAYTATHDLVGGFLLNQLNFGGATATLAGASMALTNSDAALPQVNQNSEAPVTVNNNLVLGTNVTFGGSGGGTLTVGGTVSGASGLTKASSGTLALTSANTFSGGTILDNGTIDVRNKSALGTGNVTINASGVLNYALTNNYSEGLGNTLSGNGTINYTALNSVNASSYWYSDLSAFSGTVNLSTFHTHCVLAGSAKGSASAKWVLTGTLNYLMPGVGGTFSLGELSGSGHLGGDYYANTTWQIGALGTTSTFSGVISDPIAGGVGRVAITKVGAGKLSLTSACSYSLGTVVSNGVLEVGVNGSLGTNTVEVTGGKLSLLGSSAIGNAAQLRLANAADKLELATGVNESVRELYIGGQLAYRGTWGRVGHPSSWHKSAAITGDGILTVTEGPKLEGTLIRFF